MQALLAQKGAESKEIMEAFDQLREAFFPFDRNQKGDEVRRMKEAMMREISRGALAVTPLVDPGRKRIASKLVQGDRELERQAVMQQQGRTKSIDSFNQAKLRHRGASSIRNDHAK